MDDSDVDKLTVVDSSVEGMSGEVGKDGSCKINTNKHKYKLLSLIR